MAQVGLLVKGRDNDRIISGHTCSVVEEIRGAELTWKKMPGQYPAACLKDKLDRPGVTNSHLSIGVGLESSVFYNET